MPGFRATGCASRRIGTGSRHSIQNGFARSGRRSVTLTAGRGAGGERRRGPTRFLTAPKTEPAAGGAKAQPKLVKKGQDRDGNGKSSS